jgi:hypothetical protein
MASSNMDIRRFPRIDVEGGYAIRFVAGKRRFFGLPVLSMGGGGCCFSLSSLLASALQEDMVLTGVGIEHPDIPFLSQKARVTWIAGNQSRHTEPVVRVGIEYLDPEPEFVQAIERCVEVLLRKGEHR